MDANREITPGGCYSAYPVTTVVVSTLLSLLIYGAGGYIMFQIHGVVLAAYLVLILWMEFRLLRYSCRDCWYYGKRCAFGKGKLAGYLVKKGDTARFAERSTDWKSVLPDILVSAIPILAAIVLMVIDFRWPLLVSAVLLLALVSMGNGFVRGKLACKYCAQRTIGCPADKLFDRS